MPRGSKRGERRGPGRRGVPNKPKNELALVVLPKVEAEVGTKTLGKDRLAQIDDWAWKLAGLYAPREDEKGNTVWNSEGDELRFLRFLSLSLKCAAMRAPYESPRYAAIAVLNQQREDEDPFEGVDPHKHLEDMLRRYWAAKHAEMAERKMIDVMPNNPGPIEIEPEKGPEDGEAVRD